jgi:N-acyl-phosphatidylethanolamine-hydrolysing phospholipase D
VGVSGLNAIPNDAYEPRWIMEAQHMSPDQAVQIHIDVQSKKIDRYTLGYIAIGK